MQIVQHGHSNTEQSVYQYLWSKGVPERVDDPHGNRLIAIGVKQIAKNLGTIAARNVRIVLQRLIAKQALEILTRENADESLPRQYRVLGYEQIKRKREELGLCWVVRSSRGVDFVDPQTRESLTLTSPGDIHPRGI
jgi:predicted transcriptional regulator